jgi:holo-[acyl-carrier protein] synthase
LIIGIGTDIVDIRRIKKIITSKNKFIEKIFSQEEMECLSSKIICEEYVAGRFAAKEAVAKALGTGFRNFKFNDIQIFNNSFGMPYVILKGNASSFLENKGKYEIFISISHEKEYAIAYAILEGKK